ncbi:uncharacterized protein MONBRDRAFT_26291 [Monosiga brevicollis MX1]|uniref:EGF-like domain-containing protein n=1 Tax=Monosiga brevicollis TaxID=81824 RepID=A9V1Y1_MONBE|nr:uncharacterized protein MONBRDRAFT_26291 [Monosiga brevicollis MX1]EDQ88644.1 predicted protein [Monosiga brevicollis MX1]|eukprot:XP_001746748.1 hypothetical protein [Monosiga brevicollis MX1]
MACGSEPSMDAQDGNLIFNVGTSKSVVIRQGEATIDLLRVLYSLQTALANAQAEIAMLKASQATLDATLEHNVTQLLTQKADQSELEITVASAVDSMRNYADEAVQGMSNCAAEEAAAARLALVNTTAFVGLEQRVAVLETTFVSQTSLAEDLQEVVIDVSETLDHELQYVYGNMSLLGADLANTTFNANADEILRCFSLGLVYDAESDACIPTYLHTGCPAGGPSVANAMGCASGFAATNTAKFVCNALSEWIPVSGDALVCTDVDECAAGATCPELATCTNLVGSYECRCPGGDTVARDAPACYGLYMHFLDTPEKLLFDFTQDCGKQESDVSSSIPQGAVAIVASLTSYNSLRNDHCVYSLGRDNDVPCSFSSGGVYSTNTYYNDVLQTQNGENGGPQYHGFSSGTSIIPLNGRTVKSSIHGMTHGVNYLTVYIYGYVMGVDGRSTLLEVNQVHNLRLASSSAATIASLQTQHVPASGVAGVLTTATTFVDTHRDHYWTNFGPDINLTYPNWDAQPSETTSFWGDAVITNDGDASVASAYYGYSQFLMTGTADDGTVRVETNVGFNDAGTSYLTVAVFGYIPKGPFTNIIYLEAAQRRTISFDPTTRTVINNIAPPAATGIPVTAKALITTIFTYDAPGISDHVNHLFGRDASTNVNSWDNSIHDNNVYFNDVQITHDGSAGSKNYYGFWHGTQIIPLKANGNFDAILCDGAANDGTPHRVAINIVGYVAA